MQDSSVIIGEHVSPDAGGTSLASPKKLKKAAERLAWEAKKQRAEKAQREMARAVMQKRAQLLFGDADGLDSLEWKWTSNDPKTEPKVSMAHCKSNADGASRKRHSSRTSLPPFAQLVAVAECAE